MDIPKIKIITLVGTRPEIIRLSEVIKELDNNTEHILVHTGQNYDYELSEIFFKDFEIRKPDYFLEAVGASPSETIGNIIKYVDKLLIKENPDAFLVLGDTNSCLGAYAAKRRKIPVFHMEAGNRCFDERVPEEINRRIIDHMSDINIVYSEHARQNLIQEGLPHDRIIKSGSPMYEVLSKNKEKIISSNILEQLDMKSGEYFVLSAHREENVDSDDNLNKLIDVVRAVADHYKKPIVFSTHPRTKKRIDSLKILLPEDLKIMKPLGFFDYIQLQMNSFCVLSDSGTISEESSILNFPAINIREAHERREAMDETAVIMSGVNVDRVLQSIEIAKNQSRGKARDFMLVPEYGYANVSKKILRIILSYLDYVRRNVWHEI